MTKNVKSVFHTYHFRKGDYIVTFNSKKYNKQGLKALKDAIKKSHGDCCIEILKEEDFPSNLKFTKDTVRP